MLQRLHINLPADLLLWIKSEALREGRSVSNFITFKFYQIIKEDKNVSLRTKNSQEVNRTKLT